MQRAFLRPVPHAQNLEARTPRNKRFHKTDIAGLPAALGVENGGASYDDVGAGCG
jgi:hypothetical protein